MYTLMCGTNFNLKISTGHNGFIFGLVNSMFCHQKGPAHCSIVIVLAASDFAIQFLHQLLILKCT